MIRSADGRSMIVASPGERESIALLQTPERYNINNLLKSLSSLCSVFSKDYWNYEWCQGKYVSQYHVHQQGNKFLKQPEWSLGSFSRSVVVRQDGQNTNTSSPIVKMIEYFEEGQRCDETGHGRTTEVHIECCEGQPYQHMSSEAFRSAMMKQKQGSLIPIPKATLNHIEEPSVCHYKAISCTPLLCEPKEEPNSLSLESSSSVAGTGELFVDIMKAVNNTCMVRQEDWWTYEVCLNKGIRQMHFNVESTPGVSNDGTVTQKHVLANLYILGNPPVASVYSDGNALLDRTVPKYLSRRGRTAGSAGDPQHAAEVVAATAKAVDGTGAAPLALSRETEIIREAGLVAPNLHRLGAGQPPMYLALEFTGGTSCDLNDAINRSTTVEIRCGSSNDITAPILEDTTCHYRIQISLVAFCAIPQFRQRKVTGVQVDIRPLRPTGEELVAHQAAAIASISQASYTTFPVPLTHTEKKARDVHLQQLPSDIHNRADHTADNHHRKKQQHYHHQQQQQQQEQRQSQSYQEPPAPRDSYKDYDVEALKLEIADPVGAELLNAFREHLETIPAQIMNSHQKKEAIEHFVRNIAKHVQDSTTDADNAAARRTTSYSTASSSPSAIIVSNDGEVSTATAAAASTPSDINSDVEVLFPEEVGEPVHDAQPRDHSGTTTGVPPIHSHKVTVIENEDTDVSRSNAEQEPSNDDADTPDEDAKTMVTKTLKLEASPSPVEGRTSSGRGTITRELGTGRSHSKNNMNKHTSQDPPFDVTAAGLERGWTPEEVATMKYIDELLAADTNTRAARRELVLLGDGGHEYVEYMLDNLDALQADATEIDFEALREMAAGNPEALEFLDMLAAETPETLQYLDQLWLENPNGYETFIRERYGDNAYNAVASGLFFGSDRGLDIGEDLEIGQTFEATVDVEGAEYFADLPKEYKDGTAGGVEFDFVDGSALLNETADDEQLYDEYYGDDGAHLQ